MKRGWRWLVGLVVALAMGVGAAPAWALTASDKADMSIDNDGVVHTVETGLPIDSSGSDTTVLNGEVETIYTVPTGKKAHVTNVFYEYRGTTTNVRIGLLANGKTVDQDAAPTTLEGQMFRVDVWLGAGQTVQLVATGATEGDDLFWSVYGLEYAATTNN